MMDPLDRLWMDACAASAAMEAETRDLDREAADINELATEEEQEGGNEDQ